MKTLYVIGNLLKSLLLAADSRDAASTLYRMQWGRSLSFGTIISYSTNARIYAGVVGLHTRVQFLAYEQILTRSFPFLFKQPRE